MFTTSANDVNTKMTRASWLTLGAFIILYTPSIILLGILQNFVQQPTVILIILADISNLLYFLNNVINPFLYFATLSNFREGYKCLLTCRGIPEPQQTGQCSSSRSTKIYTTEPYGPGSGNANG